jgi:hypothetical protein
MRVAARAGVALVVIAAGLLGLTACGGGGVPGDGRASTTAPPGGSEAAPSRGEAVAQVRAVAYSYFRPPKAQEGGRACVYLTAREHQRLDGLGGCAKVLNRYGRRYVRGRELVVVGVRVDPASPTPTARASVAGDAIRGTPPTIRLRREDGCWRVFDTGL